ncbi:Protein of unknown function (DUF1679) [Nesidiocoris tenuis]|uniref:CHK kinase-like domain-containing protein n=1 Tax=Nesidiocoris tenuis TaxID=355587 RepID=A0ABN7A769_9HEMI|nr:Protein of unknown function (DUF1679) [Nesidiocoris tenuis]
MEPHVVELLGKIATSEGFQDSFRTTFTGDADGNNFHGIVKTAVIEDDNTTIHVVVKLCQTNALVREAQRTHDKFVNEVIFYRDIAPRLETHGRMPRVAKYYGSSIESGFEIIVLENLKPSGYILKPVNEGLDEEHIVLVAEYLARLHRIALNWKENDPGSFEKITSKLKETFFVNHENSDCRKLASRIFEQALQSALDCAAQEDCTGRLVNSIKQYCIDLKNLPSWMNIHDSEYTTLIHGDAYCNNFLFRYENGSPTDVAFVDWQMVKVGSPAFDLVECFLSSAHVDILDSPERFLSMYSSTSHFHLEKLRSDIHRYGKPGLLVALCVLVNVATEERTDVGGKLEKILIEERDTCLSENVRARVKRLVSAARLLGVFEPVSR